MKRNLTRFLNNLFLAISFLMVTSGALDAQCSISTMNIMGSYSGSGSFDIELENTGSYDVIAVSGMPGTADISGTTLNLDACTMPNPFTLPVSAGGDNYTIVTATGGISGTFAVENLPTVAGSNPMVNLVFTVIYNANSVVVNVVDPCNPDDTNPVATCPPNTTIFTDPSNQCSGPFNIAPLAGATDNCGTPVINQITVNALPGYMVGSPVVLPVGLNTIQYRVVDGNGNTGTCAYIVTVQDNDVPIISCPADVTVLTTEGQDNVSGDCGATVVWNSPVVSDNCPGVNAMQTTTPLIGTFFTVGIHTVSYLATDAAGNTSTCSFLVTVEDDEPPTNLVCPTPTNPYSNDLGECSAELTFAATAEDNCDGTLSYTYEITEFNGGPVNITVVHPFDYAVGTSVVTATVSDGFNDLTCMYTVVVEDTENPTASNPSDINVQCFSDIPSPDVNVVTDEADNCGIPVVAFVNDDITTATCDGDVVSVTRTYSITDAAGNSITVSQNINVDDTTPPTADTPSDINVECFSDIPSPDPTVVLNEADNCDGVPTVTFDNDNIISATCDGDVVTVVRTYVVTDCSGNTSTVTQNINVDDVTPPTADTPSDINVECFSDIPTPDPTVVLNEADNCVGVPTVTFDNDNIISATCDGDVVTVIRTYVVTDCSGNTTTVVQNINVDDVTPPTADTPSDISVECFSDIPSPDPNVVLNEADNCDGTPVVTFDFDDIIEPISCDGEIITVTRTYLVTDCSGNTSTVTQTIYVDDITPPTASNPSDINTDCFSNIPAPDPSVVTDEADNCLGIIDVAHVSDDILSVICDGASVTVLRTYSVTDCSGNSITVTQNIYVDDNINPTAVCAVLTDVNLDATGNYTFTQAEIDDIGSSSSDNCLGSLTFSIDNASFDCSDSGYGDTNAAPEAGNRVSRILTVTDCAGNTATCTAVVRIMPLDPVDITPTNGQALAVCSDVPYSVDPQVYITNGIPANFTWTASASGVVTGLNTSGTGIISDTVTNLGNGNVTITYTVTPSSQATTCVGPNFTFTVLVRPEPVVGDLNDETCSDVTFGPLIGNGPVTLPSSGINIGVSNWNFAQLVLESPLSSPYPGGTSNDPGNYPFSLSNNILNRAAIQNDAFRNLGSNDADAIYHIIPVGPSPGFCLGDTFTVTGTIHPEPVGSNQAFQGCSGVTFEYDLDSFLVNVNIPNDDSDDDVEQTTYTWPTPVVTPINLLIGTSAGSSTDGTFSANLTNPFTIPLTATYTITPTSVNGCQGSTFTVAITINPNPQAAIDPHGDNTLCQGESRNVSGVVLPAATYTYAWTSTDGDATFNDATLLSPTYTAATTNTISDTITFTATNTVTGCIAEVSYVFIINPLPTFVSFEDTIYTCATNVNGTNGVFDLDADADAGANTDTYHTSYSDAFGDAGAIANIDNYVGSNGQTIYVRLENGFGCFIIDTLTLIVNPLPTVEITASDLVICDGEEVLLTATGGDSYLWSNDGETDATIDVSPSETTIYTVTVTDTNGCENTASVTITVNELPTAELTASATAVCPDEDVVLTASGGDNYLWNTGDVVNQITVYVDPGTDSTFWVEVTDVNGCVDSAFITITGYSYPTAPDVAVSIDTCALIYGGNTAEFDLTTASDSTLSFHLTESDAENGLGTIVNPTSYTGTNGQLIWFSYADANGCVAVGSFELVVNPLPTVEISASALEICVGDEVIVSATGGGDYVWSNAGETNDSIIVSPTVNTTYTVTVTDANGCENTASIDITVNPNPVATITGTDGIECAGTTITLVAGGGESYQWLNPVANTSAVEITVTADDTYEVIVTNAFGCVDTTSVDVVVSPAIVWDTTLVTNVSCNGGADGSISAAASGGTGALTYSWEDGDGNSVGGNLPVLTDLEAGTYHVTVVDEEGCELTATFNVTEPAVIEIVAVVANDLQCNGDNSGNLSGTILGGTGPYETFIEGSSYLDSLEDAGGFYFENLSADTYVITVVDSEGCSATVNIEISEPTDLSVSATPTDADCNGGNGNITVFAAGGTAGYTYFIDYPNPNTPANNPSFDVPAGTYVVHVEDSHSCLDSVEVVVGEPDTITTTVTFTEESCEDVNDGTATVVAEGGLPGYTYLWSNGQTTSVATGLGDGTYYVTVYDANGCSVVDSVSVTTGTPSPAVVVNCPSSDTFYVLDCDISYSWLAPTIVDNCETIYLTVDLDGAEDEGYALGIQQANFEPGVYNITYTHAGPDTVACAFTIAVYDTIVPVIVCPDTVQVNCIEEVPLPYENYLDFIADGGILDDNCTVSLSTFAWVSDTYLPLPACVNRDTISRVYEVTDIYGNTGECTQTIVVYDETPPVFITVPNDTLVDCDAAITPALLGTPTAEDNCLSGIDTIWFADASTQSGDLDSCDNYNYVITRTWYVSDVCGNVDSVDQIITVQDTTAPVAICQDFFVYLDTNGEAVIAPSDINDNSTDNCMPGNNLVLSLDNDTFGCDDVPSTTVILTVEDACGNSSTCSAVVTVADTVAPVAVCNSDITIYLDNLGNASIDSSYIDNGSTDNCAIRNMILSDSEFDCDDVATNPNVVTLYVYDFYDNVDSCTTNVTVLDTIAPIALCADITVDLDSNGTVVVTFGMINNGSGDACGIDTMIVSPNTFDCDDVAVNSVVLTVTDVNGNSATCSANVTVEDNIAPVATCTDITISLDSATGTYILTAADSSDIVAGTFDNCSFTASFNPNSYDCSDVFAPVAVHVSYIDPSNNEDTCTAFITVADVTPPTAVCNDLTINLDSSGNYTLTTVDSAAIVNGTFDACTWTYTLDEVSFGCSEVGNNDVVATYTDPSGNTSNCTANVLVVDNIAPVIVCQDTVISVDQNGEANVSAEELVESAEDACGIDTMIISQTDYNCSDLGPNTEIITVTDVNGNSKTCTVIVTVTDTLVPIFTECKTDTIMNSSPVSCFAPYADIYFAPITDNCTPTNALIVTSTARVISSNQLINMTVAPINGGVDGYHLSVPGGFGFSLPVGANLITVYATDGEGNIDSCQWTVQVNDVWAPSVQNCPPNITVSVNPTTCLGQAFWGGPTASDNCAGVSLMTQNNNQYFSGSFFPLGTTIVQYTATDNSGNTNTTCSFSVTVTGTCTPPAPDLSPEHILGGSIYNTGQMKTVVVRIRNLSPNPTTAPIVFFVNKMNPNFTISVDTSLTSVMVGINNYSVSNDDFDVLEQPTRWRFTSETGVVIPGNSEKLVAIKIMANNFPMSSANLTTSIQAGTGGGETPSTNNIKTNIISIN